MIRENVRLSWLVALSVLLIAPPALTREFYATYTAVTGCCGDDLNGDGALAARARAEGKGTFGAFVQDTVVDADLTGIRPATPQECDLSDHSVVIPLERGSSMVRFSDGSFLFKEVAQDGRASYACFDFLAGAVTGTVVNWTITGGTGRFAGATGTSVAPTRAIGAMAGLLAIEAEESGQIQLAE